MPGIDILIAFLLATAVFAYLPGPAMLYATARTLAGGRRAGWQAALGIHLGGYAHVAAAALGLAVLFQAVPALYAVLKIAGAVYLIYLGLRMVLSREPRPSVPKIAPEYDRRAFWQSVLVEVLNPKTALFYLAFLPQFTDPAAVLPIWAQLFVLGTIVNAMFSSADVVCVLLAGKIIAILRGSAQVSRVAKRIGGGLLVALGVNLAMSRA